MGSTSSRRWLVLASYIAAVFINQAFVVQFAPILSEIETRYGVETLKASTLLLVFPFLYLVFSIPAGFAADRRGYRFAIGIGAALQAVFAAVRIHTDSFEALLVGQIGCAIAQPFVLNGVSKLVADWFPKKQAVLVTGFVTMGMFAGMAAGMATTPALAHAVGIRGTMVVFAALAAFVGAAFFRFVRANDVAAELAGDADTYEASNPQPQDRHASPLGVLLRNRDLLLLFGFSFIALGVFNGLVTWIEAIVAPRGIGTTDAGIIGATMIVSGIGGAFVIPLLSDRAGRRKPFALACTAFGTIILFMFMRASTLPSLVTVAALLGFTTLGAFPVILEMCAEHAGPAHTATATSVFMLTGNVGGLIVMVAMPLLNGDTPSFVPAMTLLLGLMVVGTGLVALISEHGKSERDDSASAKDTHGIPSPSASYRLSRTR